VTRHAYGKLPAQPARPHLKLSGAMRKLAAPPAMSDWQADTIQWPMYANDEIGDCTCAAVGHMVNQLTFYGSGTEVQPTEAHVVAMYSAITGYNPKKPATDTGAYCQDVLAYWRKTGLEGHKIVAYAALDVSNLDEIKQAIAAFGTVYIGLSVTDAAENAFDAGKLWDVKKGSKNLGGHCVPMGAYDSTKKALYGVTWAAEFGMTEAYWKQNVEEAWVVLDEDGLNKAAAYFAGSASFYALGDVFAALTGETNPIPQPSPTPVPVPDPTPTPDPSVYTTSELAADLRAVLEQHNL
jgi:TPR repeat protein